MKDLEKIKSEDLGCQVADANPGNFAIEQEVAQLVGATVPAPTEPSADDARELGAQLLVFLRRALLPIRSALRTALAAIYSHLDSRCTDYTPAAYDPFRLPAGPYDPMRPFVPRTLPNLLTAITAFAPRKISNGSAPNDGIPDGVSLAHLLCDNSATKLVDDNRGWTMSKAFPWSYFPNLQDIVFGFSHLTVSLLSNNSSIKSIEFLNPFTATGGMQILNNVDLEGEFVCPIKGTITYTSSNQNATFYKLNKVTKAKFPNLKGLNITYGIYDGLISSCPLLEEVEAESLTSCETADTNHKHLVIGCTALKRLKVGTFTSPMYDYKLLSVQYDSYPYLIDIEIGVNTAVNVNLQYWNPTDKGTTFLQNFRDHIALRLTDQGSGKTLTLHRDVVDAIDAAEATYGIRHIICNQKGWTISPAPTA